MTNGTTLVRPGPTTRAFVVVIVVVWLNFLVHSIAHHNGRFRILDQQVFEAVGVDHGLNAVRTDQDLFEDGLVEPVRYRPAVGPSPDEQAAEAADQAR